jgi:hypothetical protein
MSFKELYQEFDDSKPQKTYKKIENVPIFRIVNEKNIIPDSIDNRNSILF